MHFSPQSGIRIAERIRETGEIARSGRRASQAIRRRIEETTVFAQQS